MIALFHLCPKHLPSGHMSNKLQPEDTLILPTRQHCPSHRCEILPTPSQGKNLIPLGLSCSYTEDTWMGPLSYLRLTFPTTPPQYCWKQTTWWLMNSLQVSNNKDEKSNWVVRSPHMAPILVLLFESNCTYFTTEKQFKTKQKCFFKKRLLFFKFSTSIFRPLYLMNGETMETVTDFIFLGSKITAGGGDGSHEI